MQYVVTEELVVPGPTSPDQLVGVMRQWVFPFMDALMELKSEGKIIGGGVPSKRGLCAYLCGRINQELDTIWQRLPLWGWQSGK
jgi:hypothetical protein